MDQGKAMGSPSVEKVTPALNLPWKAFGKNGLCNAKGDDIIACDSRQPINRYVELAANNHEALVKALEHSYSRFEQLAAQFDWAGDAVNFALCSRDAEMAAKALAFVRGGRSWVL